MNTKDNSKTTAVDTTMEENTLPPSRTAEKRNRSNSDPAPSGLRLSPVSKKVVYDGEDEVYKFDAPPPTWVTLLFSKIEALTDTVGDLKLEINERVDKFLALQADFNTYKTETNARFEKLEASHSALEQHAKEMDENYDILGRSLRDHVSKQTEDLNSCLAMFENKIDEQAKVASLAQEALQRCCTNHDEMEQYSRRNCLVIHGITEHQNENTDRLVIDTINSKLNISLSANDIDRSHRIGSRNNSAGRPRAIIVKLARYNTRAAVFRAKKLLKNTKIMITESLTAQRMTVLKKAKNQFGPRNVWTSDGEILTKNKEGKIVNITKCTTNFIDLSKL